LRVVDWRWSRAGGTTLEQIALYGDSFCPLLEKAGSFEVLLIDDAYVWNDAMALRLSHHIEP
jgi:hypothetical protein